MRLINRILLTISIATCASLSQAQTVIITNSLTPIEASSAMASYANLFGYLNNPELDNPFPYAVIRMDLVGDVREAKMRLGLYLGTMLTVEAVNKDIENTILFVVPRSAKNIYLTCGDGCEKQTLYQGSLRSNKIYTCRVEYQKEQENTIPDNTKAQVLQEIQALKEQLAQMQEQATTPSQPSQAQGGQTAQPQTMSQADFTENASDINMKMVWVEGGQFMMGCTEEQGGDCHENEKNVHQVKIDGYWIGMCEVTQSQWKAIIGSSIYQQKSKAGGNNLSGVGPDNPMYYVSWDEAMEFCRLLSQQTGKTYTLPTEAQWEYAARGGHKADGTRYAGSSMVEVVSWYRNNSGNGTNPVAKKRPNGLGLYDMSGNVWEWCKDWYDNDYADVSSHQGGPSTGTGRVFRGGSWFDSAECCRVPNRNYFTPSYSSNYIGFRVVCIPQTNKK